ncbi:hypothetical protein MBLNU230_g7350t1 [Neophaeotheca triangularis]
MSEQGGSSPEDTSLVTYEDVYGWLTDVFPLFLTDQPTLNLTESEKRAFSYLFTQADSDGLGVVTGERAVGFFERTTVPSNVLGEIWQLADTENRGLLTKPGFCMVLRLIGHYQQGRGPSTDLAFKPAPIPKFEGLQIPGANDRQTPAAASPTGNGFPANALQPQHSGGPIRVPPLDPQKASQYSGLFERSGAQNGVLDGATAKSIFERAGLPNETLGKIWMLSDREQRGALDQTEFIVAMHLLTSMKTRAMASLPNSLPQGLYEAAARKGAPPPPGNRQSMAPGAIPRQFTGGSASGGPHRAQSPLARQGGGYGPPQPLSQQGTGQNWLITQQEKAKFDQFFSTVDTQGLGVITGEQAVRFFSDSGLDEETLASIWDLADINSEGQLNRDEFAVAMYLIRQQRAPNAAPLPAFLPSALVPPSMRKQNIQQQTTQTTAPAFDNAANTSNMNKSATEDLFGLDEPSPPQQQQQPMVPIQTQGTGASAGGFPRDPFSGSQTDSPSSPQRFQPQAQQPQQGGSMFKPFQPTSAFGASLASQNTGGSAGGAQTQSQQQQQQPQPHPQQQNQHPAQGANAMDDLLGDNETHAAESSKLTNETTELANMSNQIGNLRGQMEQTQAKKATTQQDLNATNTQKRDLELRLEQFRSQYEQEVRTVKDLETQLAASRESTRKYSQELAMLEGTYQDLQQQHNTVAQALQADQQENANLKQRISQLNAETSQLKPQLEKMKLDARQQKGLVSINKKQLSTNESELERLQREKADLEREAAEREEQARNAPVLEPAPSNVASPAASTMSNTNPFFRNNSAGGQVDRAASPVSAMSAAPNPSAFDALFGPAFAGTKQADSRAGTPPATSFVGRTIPSTQDAAAGIAAGGVSSAAIAAASSGTGPSGSSDGRPTPSVTPPLSEQAKDSPAAMEAPPPPPESRQFSASQLPMRGLATSDRADSAAGSTAVFPPGSSRAGGVDTPREEVELQPAAAPTSMPGGFDQEQEIQESERELPGAFPDDDASGPSAGPSTQQPTPAARDDFDSAFLGFGEDSKAKDADKSVSDPFVTDANEQAPKGKGVSSEFPPIQFQNDEDDSDSDSDSDHETNKGFADNFAAASSQSNGTAPPTYGTTEPPSDGPHVASGDEIARARPGVQSVESTASDLPAITSQKSPPTYDQSNEPAQGGPGQRSESNSFPHEYDGLLPERDDPTSPPPPATSPPATEEPAVQTSQQESEQSVFPAEPPLSATGTAATSGTSDSFHDAFSRPMSNATVESTPTQQQQQSATATASTENTAGGFDDFDDFDDLAEAKEADKDDFGFGSSSREGADEFNPAFDSPAPSSTNTMASTTSSRTVQADNSSGFVPNSSSPFSSNKMTSSPVQETPQSNQNDWDAIFSGLDASKSSNIDTSFGNTATSNTSTDPWGAPLAQTPSAAHHLAQDEADTISPAPPRPAGAGSGAKPLPPTQLTTQSPPPRSFNPPPGPPPTEQQQRAPSLASPDKAQGSEAKNGAGNGADTASRGAALSPGTEHDDPILQRLTTMGYPRGKALEALEKFDYDINMVSPFKGLMLKFEWDFADISDFRLLTI